MKVRELMTSSGVLSAREDDDLALAAQMMVWGGVRHLPVVRGGVVVGVLSERDVLARRAQEGREAERLQVRDVMRQPALVARPDEDVREAAARMVGHRVGCLPVVEDGRLLGIVTRSDLLAHLEGAARSRPLAAPQLRIADVMHRDVATVHGDDDLVDAAARMVHHNVRHLPVVDGEGRVIGMLTDRDVRTAVGDPRRAIDDDTLRVRVRALKVWAAMTTPVVSVLPETPLGEAIGHFVDRRVGALPVVDEEEHLLGIVSYVDVLGVMFPRPAAEGTAPDAPG